MGVNYPIHILVTRWLYAAHTRVETPVGPDLSHSPVCQGVPEETWVMWLVRHVLKDKHRPADSRLSGETHSPSELVGSVPAPGHPTGGQPADPSGSMCTRLNSALCRANSVLLLYPTSQVGGTALHPAVQAKHQDVILSPLYLNSSFISHPHLTNAKSC